MSQCLCVCAWMLSISACGIVCTVCVCVGFHLGGQGGVSVRVTPFGNYRLAFFFQSVIGCKGYRTETQHREYTA